MQPLTISRAAKAVGIGVETIRFYERKKLIAQPVRPADGGARNYGGDTVARLRFIGQAQETGFSLAEISELLSLRASSATGCEDIRARAIAKRKEIQTKLDRLKQIAQALDDLISGCPGKGGVSTCTILEAMGNRPAVG